jgi:hypothetical protein
MPSDRWPSSVRINGSRAARYQRDRTGGGLNPNNVSVSPATATTSTNELIQSEGNTVKNKALAVKSMPGMTPHTRNTTLR